MRAALSQTEQRHQAKVADADVLASAVFGSVLQIWPRVDQEQGRAAEEPMPADRAPESREHEMEAGAVWRQAMLQIWRVGQEQGRAAAEEPTPADRVTEAPESRATAAVRMQGTGK